MPDTSEGLTDMAADGLRVLLVEDDPHEADLIERELSRAGFHPIVERVEDEETFRQALREFAPDVILAEDELSTFSGIRALGAAREERTDAPFLLLSGTHGDDLAAETSEGGPAPTNLVLKDRPEEIGPAVRRALGEVRARREWAPEEVGRQLSYFALVEEVPVGLLILDEQLCLTYVNSMAERFWGKPRQELLGKVIWDLFPRISEPNVAGVVQEFLASGESARFETYNDVTDQWFEVHAHRTETGYSASFLDVTDRRRAQEQRDAAEVRYRGMIEHTPAVTYLEDASTAELVYVSPQVDSTLGYTVEECLRDPHLLQRTIHPEDLEQVRRAYEAAKERGVAYEAEYRMLTKDGQTIWVHNQVALETQPDGRRLMHGAIFDITERKSAEESLRRRDAVLETVAFVAQHLHREGPREAVVLDALAKLGEAAEVGRVAVFEIEETPDGRLLASVNLEWAAPGLEPLSPRVQRLDMAALGYQELVARAREGEVFAQNSQDLPAGQPQVREEAGMASTLSVPLFAGERWLGTMALVDSYGPRTWYPPIVDAMRIAATALGAAIEEGRMRGALERSEREFRELAERANDLILRYRLLPEPAFEYVSPSVTTVTGYAPEELYADPRFWTRLIHPEDRDLLEPILSSPFDSSARFTMRAVRKDATLAWLEIQVVPIWDGEGNVEAIHGIARDVTERIRAEQQLRASLDALRAIDNQRRMLVQRLVAAQEEERLRIANDIHDDSIQLMTAVGMRLAILRNELRDTEESGSVGKLEETVQEATARLRNLIFELRPAALDREGVAAALREYIETSRREDDPEVTVHDGLPAEPSPETRVLLYRLTQEAFANVRKHAKASHVEVDLALEHRGIHVRIRDDGVGFDPEALGEAAPGHVGLISMRERAELVGGMFRVTSSPGSGTTVEFWIPEPYVGGSDPPRAGSSF